MRNPATTTILSLLNSGVTRFSLLELIKACQDDGIFDDITDCSHDVLLFRKNFIAMNALFAAQEVLWQGDIGYLVISPASNVLEPMPEGLQTADDTMVNLPEQSRDTALRSYYQDWQHYDQTGQAEVEALLTSFWTRYLSPDKTTECCELLEISVSSATRSIAKKQFKRMAAQHHPDRGGNSKTFIQLRQAYEHLMTALPE